jgi:serine/threonine protein kinase
MAVIPDKIGKYEIVQEVGRGSMGTVYSAHDPFSDRLVAIKVAHPQYVDQSKEGQRFRKLFFNEAHAAGSLDHPNILKIFDADVEGDLCYLVMEFVEGAKTLEEYVRPDRLLTLREVVGIIYKCAKALDYAHRQGVIHRDIKPSNLLLNEERDVKLADFSIAMITRADNKHTQFTGFLGSPLYMSPEQINEQPLSSATDIFSLGTVMYQMLTGNHPFKADNLNAINQRITNEEPPALSTFRQDLPDGLSYTLRRMLRKNASQRYQTGLDLAADLAVIFEDLDAVPNEDALREKFGTIKNLGFFKGFSDADIWELIRACTWQNYPAGTPVIKEGESDHSFYIVLSGVVGIEKNGRAVDSLQEGACFGEMGYLSRAKRTATVVAKTDVSLMKVNASTIDRAAESTQLRFHKVFVRTLIARLADTTSLLAQLSPV